VKKQKYINLLVDKFNLSEEEAENSVEYLVGFIRNITQTNTEQYEKTIKKSNNIL
jgi:polyhydroxyalkanoate synthesis regulator phasin